MGERIGGVRRAEILAAEASRLLAMRTGDLATLETLLDKSLNYVHSTGRVDDRCSLLGFLRRGNVKYISLEHELDQMREIAPGVVLSTGSMYIRLVNGDTEKSIHSRTTNVWVWRSVGWCLTAFHATAVSCPEPRSCENKSVDEVAEPW